jgi:hypothetical protein
MSSAGGRPSWQAMVKRKELPSLRPGPARRSRTRRGITCRYGTAGHSLNS